MVIGIDFKDSILFDSYESIRIFLKMVELGWFKIEVIKIVKEELISISIENRKKTKSIFKIF